MSYKNRLIYSVCTTILWMFSGIGSSELFGATFDVVINNGSSKAVIVSGPIEIGDSERFISIIEKDKPSVVILNSPGGLLLEGLKIGMIIQERSLSTLVSGDKLCASSCALAWLGGVRRYVDPSAKIGFHAAYISNGTYKRETGVGNALVGAFIANLGLGYNVVSFVTSAPPTDIRWLSFEDAARIGISLIPTDTKIYFTPSGRIEPHSRTFATIAREAADHITEKALKGGLLSLEDVVKECYVAIDKSNDIDKISYCFMIDILRAKLFYSYYSKDDNKLAQMGYGHALGRIVNILSHYKVNHKEIQSLLNDWTKAADDAFFEKYSRGTKKR